MTSNLVSGEFTCLYCSWSRFWDPGRLTALTCQHSMNALPQIFDWRVIFVVVQCQELSLLFGFLVGSSLKARAPGHHCLNPTRIVAIGAAFLRSQRAIQDAFDSGDLADWLGVQFPKSWKKEGGVAPTQSFPKVVANQMRAMRIVWCARFRPHGVQMPAC